MFNFRFDLEDGLPRVELSLNEVDGERFVAFMQECTDAIGKAKELEKQLAEAQKTPNVWHS
jgi:hypothetical protein